MFPGSKHTLAVLLILSDHPIPHLHIDGTQRDNATISIQLPSKPTSSLAAAVTRQFPPTNPPPTIGPNQIAATSQLVQGKILSKHTLTDIQMTQTTLKTALLSRPDECLPEQLKQSSRFDLLTNLDKIEAADGDAQPVEDLSAIFPCSQKDLCPLPWLSQLPQQHLHCQVSL